MPDLDSISTAGLVAIAILAVVQLALAVTALVLLARTPRERVVFGARWPWVLIILASSMIGSVVFLAVGRRPAPAVEPVPATGSRHDTQGIVGSLYGDRP